MELGEKLRQARQEAGMTQKQLSQDIVTRNMLSQIENGTASPSMKTLQLFARRLGKNVSFFLEETAVLSPNRQAVEEARQRFDGGDWAGALEALEEYREPDRVYDREKQLLEKLCLLELARSALETGREGYARELLKKAERESTYCGPELERQRLLLLGKLPGERVSGRLPGLDEELLLRAGEAFAAENPHRAAQLLEACEEKNGGTWNLLRGKLWLEEKDYARAKNCLMAAEPEYPREAVPLLEICFRELGDFRKAYEYACKQR